MEGKHSNPQSHQLLHKIKDFTRSIVEDLSQSRSPLIYINRFRNYCTDPSGNCFCSHDTVKGVEILTIRRDCHARRLDVLLRVLLIVQKLLQENRHASKRDIYYMHPSVFGEQSVVDRAVNDICILLQCSRHNLNVVSVAKGLVMGWLRFSEANRIFNCLNHPDTAHSIPVLIEEVKDIVSVADYILVVEKESVFQRLANDGFCKSSRCIVITGRGYPDISTRRFLRLLIEQLHLPTYCLVDCDPYGFDILTTYRFGSMQMAYDAKMMKLPEIQWLGVFPSDATKYSIPKQCLLPMTPEDKIRTEAILNRCYLQREEPEWRLELQLLLQGGVKFEIEALSVQSLSLLSKQYLPSKIQDTTCASFPAFFRHSRSKECCLKVHSQCDSCMMTSTEVLRSIRGVYSVTWDAQQNLFKISGEVDPNVLLKAVMCKRAHAELVTVKLNHPQLRHRNYNNYGSYGPNTGHHMPPYRHGYSSLPEQPPPYVHGYRSLPEQPPPYRHGYSSLPEQPYYVTNNPNPYVMPSEPTPVVNTSSVDHQTQLPPAIHVPSYPYHEYGPNENVDGSSCTIL